MKPASSPDLRSVRESGLWDVNQWMHHFISELSLWALSPLWSQIYAADSQVTEVNVYPLLLTQSEWGWCVWTETSFEISLWSVVCFMCSWICSFKSDFLFFLLFIQQKAAIFGGMFKRSAKSSEPSVQAQVTLSFLI